MNHTIKLLDIIEKKDNNHCRKFLAIIDEIEIEGTVQLIQVDRTDSTIFEYRIYFPKSLGMTKHKDYKNIRRNLLKLMIEEIPHQMIDAESIIR